MYLGRVIGSVVCSQKVSGLEGVKLLLVERLDHTGARVGRPHVAADVVQAGPGDFVHLVSSREAALAMEETFVPVDAAIVGIVDQLDVVGPAAGDAAAASGSASAGRSAPKAAKARPTKKGRT
ncbi:MAG: EutN/CcmL family microcompartment protein [Myxococcales bacterium]|nr:EutN/CcmL family microcompartment protein [Myxococcales bacterium]